MNDKANNASNHTNVEKYDRCVLCGRATGFKATVPVGIRTDYVVGAGQLCPECAALIYGKHCGR